MATVQSLASVQKLYLSYLHRPADPEGLLYWATALEGRLNGDILPIARSFGNSTEAKALLGLPGADVGSVLDKVYQSLFGRMPDAEGKAYWTAVVNEGRVPLDELPYAIVSGAGASDSVTIQNKEAAARLFTETIDGRSFTSGQFGTPPFQATFDGADAAAARNYLANVSTVVPSADSVRQTVASTIANPGDPLALPVTSVEQKELVALDINTLNDPLFLAQWYLKNTGQRYAAGETKPEKLLDVNIAGAWADGYTGKGIIVAVNDDGLDLKHEDLVNNILANLTYNSANGKSGADVYTTPTDENGKSFTPVATANEHGTVVASIVGMQANDGKGMVGLAPDVKLVSGLAIIDDKTATDTHNNTSVPALYNYLTDTARADVWVNSFGKDPAFSENFFVDAATDRQSANYVYFASIEKAAKEGRNGLGTIIEVSAGNEGPKGADAAMTGTTNSKYIITVGAMNELGQKASYTTPGASVLVSSFGGENPQGLDQSVNSGFGLASADISGEAGYNKDTSSAAGNYAFQNTGTSYSGPMVGATAALMLQANPLLGFRDISNILAMTARVIDADSYTATRGNLVNFGGLMFSRDVGFGLLDVTAAVRLAASWVEPAKTTANWISSEGKSATTATDIPDASATGTTVTAELTKNVLIERMEFDLKLTSDTPSQLRAEITSPQGTTITLFDQPLAREGEATTDTAWPGTFQIGATAFLGEQSAGTWTLKLIDKVTGEVSRFETLTVRAWGSEITSDSHYVLNDAFSGQKTVTDDAGADLINAAAVSTAVTIDLNAGATSTIANGKFVIGTGVLIENAFGGAGNDTLIGNELANILRGNGGADTLTGGGGADTFVFATANNSKTGVRDIVTDFTIGTDKIDLRLLDANFNQAGNQDFAFAGQRADVTANSVVYNFVGSDTLVLADMNGDTIADVEIMLVGQKQLTASDFLGLTALAA